MSLVISNNLNSLYVQNALSNNQSAVSAAMQQLSTGMRINSAADDAAGLAIATNINALSNGDTVAIQNTNNANSLAQIADGALANVSKDLQTLNNLAVEAANGTNSASNRAALQTQAQALVADIQNNASNTNYNGVNLLNGSFNSTFQIGAAAGNSVSLKITSVQTSALGSGQGDGASAQGTGAALASGDLVVNGVAIAASQAASDTSSYTNQADSAIAKVAAINAVSSQTNVVATADATVAQGSTMTASSTAGTATLTLNGVAITLTSVVGNTSSTRQSEVAAINAVSGQTGVSASDTGSDTTGVSLSATDGRNITSVMNATASWTGLNNNTSTASTVYAGYTLASTNNSSVTVAEGTTTGLADSGLQAGTYQPSISTVSSTSLGSVTGTAVTSLASGDLVINGVSVSATNSTMDSLSYDNSAGSSVAISHAINSVSAQTGVTATANATLIQGSAITSTSGQSGNLTINGVSTSLITLTGTASTDVNNEVNAINAISGQSGVTATVNSAGTGMNLTAADGRNISIKDSAAGTLSNADLGLSASAYGGTVQMTSMGSYTLSSGGPITVSSNTLNGQTNGALADGSYGGSQAGQLLSNLNISTVDGANQAITAISNALNQVNNIRTTLGAFENRMAATVNNLQSSVTNLTTAYTNITGADYATQTANLSRAQVIQQAGIAVLAQANAQSQQVLTLLR